MNRFNFTLLALSLGFGPALSQGKTSPSATLTFNHQALFVHNLDISVRFYAEILASISALESRLACEIEDRRSRAGHQLVVRLDDENPTPRALVGGKALGLMSLRRVLPRD